MLIQDELVKTCGQPCHSVAGNGERRQAIGHATTQRSIRVAALRASTNKIRKETRWRSEYAETRSSNWRLNGYHSRSRKDFAICDQRSTGCIQTSGRLAKWSAEQLVKDVECARYRAVLRTISNPHL